MSDTPLTSKILDIMRTPGLRDGVKKLILSDHDVRKMILWFILSIGTAIVSLFISPMFSLTITTLIGLNAYILRSFVLNKVSAILSMLKKVREESEVISYNKGLTDAINLLFHNKSELRERGREVIMTEYPEHSEIILSSERIMLDSNEDEFEDIIPSSKNARLN